MRRHRIPATMLTAVLVLTAAACQGDSPEPPPVTSTPIASPTPTPTPTAAALPDFTKWQDKPADIPVPPMPAAAKKHTRAGSVAFGKYYMALVNYTLLTANTNPLVGISDSSCAGCKPVAKSLARSLSNGRSYLGDPRYTIESVMSPDFSSNEAGVSIETHSGAIKARTREQEVSTIKADRIGIVLRVSFRSGNWTISSLSVGNLQ